jgi:hypothetical protein
VYLMKVILLSRLLILSVPDEGYSRNMSCTLNLISMLLFLKWRFLCNFHLFNMQRVNLWSLWKKPRVIELLYNDLDIFRPYLNVLEHKCAINVIDVYIFKKEKRNTIKVKQLLYNCSGINIQL